MPHDRVKINFRLEAVFNRSTEFIESAEALEFHAAINFCKIQRAAENLDGFVIRFQRHRKWVSVLAAESE